jgi:hypothetical protein
MKKITKVLRHVLVLIAACVSMLPICVRAADIGTTEIYESYGTYALDAPPPGMRPVVLAIPRQFLYGMSKNAPPRAWGVNLLTYYPSFTAASESQNTNFDLNCVGICNGRILISIQNRAHSIDVTSPNMGEYIARAQMKFLDTPPLPTNAHVRQIQPVEGFNVAIERTLVSPADPKVAQIDRLYMRSAKEGVQYDLAATCSTNLLRTTCTLHFSLSCNPTIYVSVVGLDDSYLSRSQDIRERADQFISGMVRDPPCKI